MLISKKEDDHQPDTDVGDDQGDHVTEHVEGVGHEGHGVGEVTHDELDQHEAGCHGEHAENTGPSAATCGATQESRKLHPQSQSSVRHVFLITSELLQIF